MQKAYSKQTSRWAIASLYFALAAIISLACSFFFIFIRLDPVGGFLIVTSELLALVAFVWGVFALVIITIRRKRSKGYIPAITGILLSTPFVLMFLLSILVGLVRAEREKANTGIYNLRLLRDALTEYSRDHNGCLPPADGWCDLLLEHNRDLTRDNFRFPKPDRFELTGECHFAFNRNLGGLPLSDIPGDVVLLFEADGDWNLNGTAELLSTRSKGRYISLLLVDGTVNDYWFHERALRKFDSKGTRMYYEQPRWNP